MVFTVDFLGDGEPLAWSLTGTDNEPGWTVTRASKYSPVLYAVTATGMEQQSPDPAECKQELESLRSTLEAHPAAESIELTYRRPGYRFTEQPVLKLHADRTSGIRTLGTFIERQGPPGQVPYRAFNVDFTPEFRFCLETNVSPKPPRLPTVLHINLSREAAANEDLTDLEIGTKAVAQESLTQSDHPMEGAGDTDISALETVSERLSAVDPDVLAVERGEIIPLVANKAEEYNIDLSLPREPDLQDSADIATYQQLAGSSTFESYGQIRHSPARYNVPGRVIIDRSNTFFFNETNLAGCLDLVERSSKPLQELAWASIGNVLTSIQIREAHQRNVLVQWRAWRPERFKEAAQLHAGDRGGTTLSPIVGFHEDVHELDFGSLYPNIICQFNLSPETVRCTCHERSDVPELGYSVCDEDGYLPDVLQPIIDDRADMKAKLAAADTENGPQLTAAERSALEGQISALKWILVSCFGYQGFSNAKFGRIEVHEAINAYARDILLTAKERLEAGGWRVLHGIVDSVWVTPNSDVPDRRPLDEIAAELTAEIGIPLEYEGAFDWVVFCPLRNGEAGALTRYFGRHRSEGEGGGFEQSYKLRGIECRQRSTCSWVASVQQDLIQTLDQTRDPEQVCDRLKVHLRDLHQQAVKPSDLVITTRASKDVAEYTQRNRTVAALERAQSLGMDTYPGQDVHYVVVNDEYETMERVRLESELSSEISYDVQFYRTRAIRATESILGALGWDAADINQYLDDQRAPSLRAFSTS